MKNCQGITPSTKPTFYLAPHHSYLKILIRSIHNTTRNRSQLSSVHYVHTRSFNEIIDHSKSIWASYGWSAIKRNFSPWDSAPCFWPQQTLLSFIRGPQKGPMVNMWAREKTSQHRWPEIQTWYIHSIVDFVGSAFYDQQWGDEPWNRGFLWARQRNTSVSCQ